MSNNNNNGVIKKQIKIKKAKLLDKDILVGDNIHVKITQKQKKQKIMATIKWKGEGKFFGPGIWYRVDLNGTRHFFQKEDIIKNLSFKKRDNTSIESGPKQEKRKKTKTKIKKTRWMNIHFVGCPDLTKKNKQFKMYLSLAQSSTFEVAELKEEIKEEKKYNDDDDDKDDEKKTEEIEDFGDLGDLGDIGGIGGMKEMGRGRSQSQPKPQIAHKKNKLSVNEIYSLKGVESRSIRIYINPKKWKVSELKTYITAKFQIPAKSKILLMYNNCTLTNNTVAISYYGIDNHSCLLLCISEPPAKKKPIKEKPIGNNRGNRRSNRRMRNTSALPNGRNRINRSNNNNSNNSRNRRRNRASSGLPNGRNIGNNNNNNDNEGGISGIDNNQRRSGNNLNVPNGNDANDGNNALVLSQSTSVIANGGILKDKSKPLRVRINKFCESFKIERMTDLDIYTFDIDKNCIRMQCGHGMPRESLFAYAEAQFKDGKKIIKCPHLKNNKMGNKLCKGIWNFQVIRKILLSGESPRIEMEDDDDEDRIIWENCLFGIIVIGYLRENVDITQFTMDVLTKIYQYSLDKKREAILRRSIIKRMMTLEIECAKNKFIDIYDYQRCSNCSLFIYRKKVSLDNVKCFCQCPLCDNKFCWLCSNEWKVNEDEAAHCGNNDCTNPLWTQHLNILQKCKTKTIGSVNDIPEVRACPKCNELIFHVTACKHMSCRSCKTNFCFCCLGLYKNGWQCGSSSTPCPVAPRQKGNILVTTNRGTVQLFKLLH